MAIVKLKSKEYSDAVYVDGVYRRDHAMERALYNHCKQYFDENYKGVFFVGDEHKMEIFQEAFITLWEKIEMRKIYVEEGVLKGKGGLPFTSNLTTYFMSIAKNKFMEWVRDQHVSKGIEDVEKKRKAKEAEYYKEILYDKDDNMMLDIIADCISHMSERCNQILTMFYYEEKTLDDILIELPSFESKNALKTTKYKCMENLRKSAQELYHRFINA